MYNIATQERAYSGSQSRSGWQAVTRLQLYTVVDVNIKREMVLSPNDEEVADSSKKNIPNSRLESTNHTLPYSFQTKMVEIDPLFQTKTDEKPLIPFDAAHTHIAYKRNSSPPGEKRFADYKSRCLRKRD